MPANRSRTERWRENLEKIAERGGGLEITIDHGNTGEIRPSDLLWRVRVLNVGDHEIICETPGALGERIAIAPGTPLLCVMSVGQNRWMFHSEALGERRMPDGDRALRMRTPERVERCQRRTFDRISTASLSLPPVDCWPLVDPRSAATAEAANRVQIMDMHDAGITGTTTTSMFSEPEVGAQFHARLANIGGGGVGLEVNRRDASAVSATRLFWLKIDLRPIIPAPIGLTARLAHTHMDSGQNIYAGMAFEFGLNPSHKRFVIDQIGRYMREMQTSKAA